MFATLILLAFLPTCEIELGKQKVQVEIAATWSDCDKGLKGRRYLAKNSGMLFVFDRPQILRFWMKDTLIPLSIAFFDEKKKLIEILDMQVPSAKTARPPLYQSSKPALYALEMSQNWFRENQIEIGVEFSLLNQPDQLE